MLHVPTAEWTESCLDFLIREKVEEGEAIDYKLQLPVDTKTEKAKAAKHVSAFANTFGGRIVIGMDEHEVDGHNYPVKKAPLAERDYVDRLLNTLRAHCQPMPAIAVKPIDLADGSGFCLVVDVAESLSPVMTVGTGENRYYQRVKWNSVAMNERQVRERYERMQTRRDAIEALVAETDPMPCWDPSTGLQSPWLTILTVPSFGALDLFNPAEFQPLNLLFFFRSNQPELARHLPRPKPTYFGLESIEGSAQTPEFMLRIHRTGVIEFHHAVTDAKLGIHQLTPDIIDGPLFVHARQQGQLMLEVLELAENLYRHAGYLSHLHVRGSYVGFGGWHVGSARHGIITPKAHSMDTRVDCLSEDRFEFAQGLLDRVWQAAGAHECDERLRRLVMPA
jgi:Putative DNA-binding domain